MPVLKFGEKLSSVYMERFNPPEGQPTKIALLALQTIATECHWLDYQGQGIRGMYQCIHGVCCQAFGNRTQNYHVPVFVYSSADPVDGTMMDWSMPPTVYRTVVDLASRYNLLDYDLEVRKDRKGNTSYTTTTVTVVPDVKLRDRMSDDMKQKLQASVEDFFSVGDSSMFTPMDEREWVRVLNELGYDFQSRRFVGAGYGGSPHIGYGPSNVQPLMSPAGSVSAMGQVAGQAGFGQPAVPPSGAVAGQAREISMEEIDSLLKQA